MGCSTSKTGKFNIPKRLLLVAPHMPGLASSASVFASPMKLSLSFFVLWRRHDVILAFLSGYAVYLFWD
jgi:hypothetical protein